MQTVSWAADLFDVERLKYCFFLHFVAQQESDEK